MLFSIQVSILALAALGTAQLNGLPTCAKPCAQNLPANCNLDVKCICSDQSWITGISCCVANACSTADQKQTLNVAQQLCATVQVTLPQAASCPGGSGASSAAPANSPASSAASAAGGSTASPAASGAASAASGGTASSATGASGSSTSSPSSTSSTAPKPGASGSTGGAEQVLGSKMGAVGAAVAALALL